MSQRYSRARPAFAPPRRKMFWARTQNQTITGSLGFATDMMSSWRGDAGVLLNVAGLTVIRWMVTLQFRAVAVDDTIVELITGILVAPIDDPPAVNSVSQSKNDRDFVMWWNPSYVQERQEGTPTQNLMYRQEFDIRSARKLDAPGRTPYFICESQNSDTQDYSWSSQILCKMP